MLDFTTPNGIIHSVDFGLTSFTVIQACHKVFFFLAAALVDIFQQQSIIQN